MSQNSVSLNTMRAAVIASPRAATMQQDIEVPEPGPHQLRVRVEGCGVCGSSLPLWQGREWFTYPLQPGAPGHEGWGEVDAVGDDVAGFAVGDRVAMLSYNAFAEFDVTDAHAVVKLPATLSGHPFPGEALGCAVNVIRRCDLQAGHTVAVLGIGFLGALLTQLAASAGANVIAVSRRPFALELARQMGADEVVLWDELSRVAHRILDLTGGRGCDRTLEATGHQAALDLATDITAERGRLIIAGYHQDGLRQINLQQWNWRGLDVINAHERDPAVYVQGMREAADAVARGLLDPSPLYTHTFALDEIDKCFELLEQRPDGFLKSLVMA